MIVQIVNAVPPDRSGLADYARKLQEHWPDRGETWSALALRVPKGAEAAWPGVTLHVLAPSAEALVETLGEIDPDCVLLHYVPHGYDPRGLPRWFIDGLEAWKRQTGLPVFCVFHELYVWAAPWRRSYLAVAPSKALFRRLAAVTDGWIVSNARYFREACAEGADPEAGKIIPIGTNIEPPALLPTRPARTKLAFVVFGLPASRIRALRAHRRLLATLGDAGLVASVHLVGVAPNERERATIQGLISPRLLQAVTATYDATEREISEVLCASDVGLCAIEAPIATKSGVFAAFCAHGVVPVVDGGPLVSTEPPFIGNDDRHVAAIVEMLTNEAKREQIRAAALQWSATVGSWSAIGAAVHAHLAATCKAGVNP